MNNYTKYIKIGNKTNTQSFTDIFWIFKSTFCNQIVVQNIIEIKYMK